MGKDLILDCKISFKELNIGMKYYAIFIIKYLGRICFDKIEIYISPQKITKIKHIAI